ncbi:hypothetical protein GPALN_013143 [Globodera pallida]|nr:hypothetical protein GPALN_013143 [Globodera pallida]
MFFMGIIDSFCLAICSFMHGILPSRGAVFCSHPALLHLLIDSLWHFCLFLLTISLLLADRIPSLSVDNLLAINRAVLGDD